MFTFLSLATVAQIYSVVLCLVPEVSQEGLLHPYTTYNDVTLFHFHIPAEVTRVSWEFAAFMDRPWCPAREVHVLVQHGSYPVVNVNNKTFQGYMYIQRSQLHKLTLHAAYQPHDASVLPVYNPLPGSWFAAAYIPNWTEQMQQEGIIHKCRYSLGSIAMWTQKDHVKTLNVGMTQTIHTKENLSYYRFFVPSNTWYLEVKLTSCHIWERRMDPDTGSVMFRWCANSIVLEARSLPLIPLGQSSNPNNSNNSVITNITEAGRHVFYERHPYADGYYYLLVNTEGETLLDVTITTKECVSGFQKTRNHMYSISKSVLREATSELQQTSSSERNLSNITLFDEEENIRNISEEVLTSPIPKISISSSLATTLTKDYNSDESSSSQECYPVLPLERIKHTTDFTDTFLIQGPEWYSSWVAVHATMPLYTHFTLLPFTDIGGTLSVNIHMDEVLMNASSQVISVSGCVSKGRPPQFMLGRLQCEEQLQLNITSISARTVESQVLVPFPEPDTWYLAMHTNCYYKGLEVSCAHDQVLVSVDVRTVPCVYGGERPCGDHGSCQETHHGMFFFTTCLCHEGWSGWGCEERVDTQGLGSVLDSPVLLTLSNVFFLPPALLAAKRRLYSHALLFTATMVASVLYHTCDTDKQMLSHCVAEYSVLQFCDFFFSLLCFWFTVVGLGGISAGWSPLLHTCGVVVIAPAVQCSRTSLATFIVPMAAAAALLVLSIVYVRYHKGSWPTVRRREVQCIIVGITLALLGLGMFALIQTKANYKYIHSLWHCVIAFSLVFLLPSTSSSSSPLLSSSWRSGDVWSSSATQQLPLGITDLPDDAILLDVPLQVVDWCQSSGVVAVGQELDSPDEDLLDLNAETLLQEDLIQTTCSLEGFRHKHLPRSSNMLQHNL